MPVLPTAHHGVVAVSGYEEASEIYLNNEDFSSCNSVIGPFATFPVPLEGDDVSDIIDGNREVLPMYEHMVTMDPPQHTQERALIMRLLTPKRLKENEAFMWRLADRQIDEFVDAGHCEFISAYTQPFAMLVVADVLGVPESDHERFREGFGLGMTPGKLGAERKGMSSNALCWLDDYFARVHRGPSEEPARRRPDQPRAGHLSRTAPRPRSPTWCGRRRSSSPPARRRPPGCLAVGLKYLSEYPELQDELRAHKERIPGFIEEALRIESPVKADFRLARRHVNVAGVDIAPGTPVMLLNGAANRDPRLFECPEEFRVDRPNAKVHIAFGRGVHACPGGPLARAEGRVSIERILDRMHNIRLSEEHHGPPTERHFEYEPTWVLRGLHKLYLEFTPAEASK